MIFNRNKAIEEGDSDIEIINNGDEIDPHCGIDATIITEKHMNALNEGKALFFDDGEYTHIIIKG